MSSADRAAVAAQNAYRSMKHQGATDREATAAAGQAAVRGGGLQNAADQGYIQMVPDTKPNKYTGGK